MSSKTDINYYNLLIIVNFIFHNKIKFKRKNSFNSKIKLLAEILQSTYDEIEYIFLYLLQQSYISIEEGYLKVNWDAIYLLILNGVRIKKNKDDIHNTVIFQNNFEIIVKPEIDLKNFLYIVKIAEFVSKDIVYRFKLTENSLHNAYLINITPESIINFIKESNNTINDNVLYFVKDVYKRLGELRIYFSGGIISGNKFLIKHIQNIDEIKQYILRVISDNLIVLKSNSNLKEIFYILKEKKFFPIIETSEIEISYNRYLLSLSSEELINIYSAVLTLNEISFSHNLSINFNIIKGVLNNIEKVISEKDKKDAIEKVLLYKKALEKKIKEYILDSVKLHIDEPRILKTNAISSQFKGKNPATTKEEMEEMIDFAISHHLSLIVHYIDSQFLLKSKDYFVTPLYLYENILKAVNKNTKEEIEFDLKKIKFLLLI